MNKNQLHIKISQPELITNRLLLRKISVKDLDDLQNVRYHPEVLKYIRRDIIDDKKKIESFILDRQKDIEIGKIYYWVISTLEAPKLIGTICLWNFNNEKTIAEIGYELHPDYHGKGFMSEAMEKVLNFGFKALNLRTIEAFTSKHNEASKMLLNKFNFYLEPNRIDEGFPNNIIYTKQHA